jgi:hypothetical protein
MSLIITFSEGKNMRTVFSLGIVAILGLLGGSQAKGATSYCTGVAGNIVVNCGFETGVLSPWAVSGNTTDPPGGFDGSEYGSDAGDAATGNFGFYAGPIGSALVLTQTLTLMTQEEYEFTFAIEDDAANPDPATYTQQFSATLNGDTLLTLTNPVTVGSFTTESFLVDIETITSDSVSFSFRNDTNYWSFDDVVVVALGSAIPEPSSLMLVAGSLLGLGAALVRKRSSLT